MMSVNCLFKFFCFIAFCLFISNCDQEFGARKDELKAVIVVFRHGMRTPITTLPTDPYHDISNWHNDWGQLTDAGIRQHYALGKWFRKVYDGFLPKNYSCFDIVVKSTDVDRTLMSAESNLAGLYSESENSVSLDGNKRQVIPIHTTPQAEDAVLAGKKKCHYYSYLYNSLLKSEKFEKFFNVIDPVLKHIANNSGTDKVTFGEASELFATYGIEEFYNYTLPAWISDIYPEPLRRITEIEIATYAFTTQLQRLKIGLLFNEWISKLESVLNNDISQKFFMYSGHDNTIANVLSGLNSFQTPFLPPFCSTIILEMFNDSSIQIWYKNSTNIVAIENNICPEPCNLPKLKKALEPVTINAAQWESECFYQDRLAFYSIVTIIAIVLCVLAILVVLKKFLLKR